MACHIFFCWEKRGLNSVLTLKSAHSNFFSEFVPKEEKKRSEGILEGKVLVCRGAFVRGESAPSG